MADETAGGGADITEATSQREMMRLVAQLYYVRELGQPEIASLTGFSISKVSRLLSSARSAGVVRISVEGAPSAPTPLARSLSEALGVEVKVGWLLDTFGHHAQMPQVLKLAGFNSFWFARGVENRQLPSEFLWQGLDGTRIRTHWLARGYGNIRFPSEAQIGHLGYGRLLLCNNLP